MQIIHAFTLDLLRWERDQANNPTGCSFVLSCKGETIACISYAGGDDYEMLVVTPHVWRHYEDCCKIDGKHAVACLLNALQPYGGEFGVKTLNVYGEEVWTLEMGVG